METDREITEFTEAEARDLLAAPGTVLAGRARALIAAVVDELFGDAPFTAVIPEASCTALFAAVWRPRATVLPVPPDPTTGVASADAHVDRAASTRPPGLVLLTDAFGFRVGAASPARRLRERGWHVLQNDPCGVRVGEEPPDDVLGTVCSFGPGKVIDAGAGGAFFTRDPDLARRLRSRIAGYPPLDLEAERVEDYLIRLRRALWYGHPSGRSLLGRWRAFLEDEAVETRRSLSADRHPALVRAIAGAGRERRERNSRAELWSRLLADADGRGIVIPTARPAAWWRYNVLLDHRRPEAIALLSSMGVPAGRLYPSLAEYFPDLCGEPSASCASWSARVLNLPVSGAIPVDTVRDAARSLVDLVSAATPVRFP